MNEYFIECSDILSPYLCKLFNAVLDSGCFPDVWSEGIVIPQCLFALKGLLKMKKYKVMLHICTSLYKYNFCSVLFCSTNQRVQPINEFNQSKSNNILNCIIEWILALKPPFFGIAKV